MHKSVSVEVPDPITFITSGKYLDRPQLYPRQATLLKIIFLREDLFTEYDYVVVAEWERDFAERGKGVCPQVLERMRWLKALGYRWFREVLLVMGRRAGKGYVCALAMAYVIWCYLALGDPQEHYGIDRYKQLACFIFAAKKEAAIQNLWGDLYNVITNAPCFTDFVNRPLGTTLTVYAPADFAKMTDRAARGVDTSRDAASFLIDPKETSPTAGRGPAGCIIGLDEMAHVVKAVAKSEAGKVYDGATPSLDQFGVDAFICAPSSPWEMTGKFYELCQLAMEMEDGEPVHKSRLMVQLESWAIYYDWERWEELDLLPPGFLGDLGEYADQPLPRFAPLRGAIQTYDDQMRLEERANPETFNVERRASWASVMEAYMIAAKVDEVFQPWEGRREESGPPEIREQSKGQMTVLYKAHGDPAEVNCTFGFSLAHVEHDAEGLPHVVFDLIKHWDPADYPDHILDYDEILEWIYDHAVVPFMPTEVTFDQWNSIASVRGLQKLIRLGQGLPKRVEAYEKNSNHENNWKRYEQLKAAINLGRVHAPMQTPSHELVRNELKFLQRLVNKRVDHPTSGPIQTKDTADTMAEVTSYLIGDQLDLFVREGLRSQRVGGAMRSPGAPLASGKDQDLFSRLGRGGGMAGGRGLTPAGRPRRR
jgi:hypothetical protein